MKILPERTRQDVVRDMVQMEDLIMWANEPTICQLCKDDIPKLPKNGLRISVYLP